MINKPEETCWCVENATRVGVLVDAAAYFEAFAQACEAAEQQIFILGWDFDRRERLFREQDAGSLPEELGAFLTALVRRRKGLQIYLLSWDFHMVYAAERELLPALRLRLQAPRRFHFRLDGEHPQGASHHQKVVVIDDRVAFVGGIDLSRWRWDTPEHGPDDPRRVDPDGKPYPPFHDMVMAVEGDPARRLGELARERWHRSHGRRPAAPGERDGTPWPGRVDPVLSDVAVAIARTEPAHAGRPAVDEVRRLYLAAIADARRFIYIENQYFTAGELADAIMRRLDEPDGPEVIMVLPRKTGGWLEQATMDVLRSRRLAAMRKADRHDRLRVYYPHQPGLGDACISVHAKLMIVDDRHLRIGSSNASNRSMGLDTECDLAIEASADDESVVDFIGKLRRRLLAEHLGCNVQQVMQSEAGSERLIPALEQLRSDARSLRDLEFAVPEKIDEMVPDSELIDPSEPFSGEYFVSEYVPEEQHPVGRKRLLAFLALIACLLVLAGAWRWTALHDWLSPQRLSVLVERMSMTPDLRGFIAIVVVACASFVMVPLTLLAIACGIVFDGWQAFFFMLGGATCSLALGFVLGQFLGDGMLERLAGSRVARLSKRVARHGVVSVAVLRLVPIAPFAIINLVAGASHLNFRQFVLGSVLGLIPGLGVVTLFSSTLWSALTSPTWMNGLVAAAATAVLIGFSLLAKRWLRSG